MAFINDIQQKGKEHEWHATWIHPNFIDRNGLAYFWFYRNFDVDSNLQNVSIDISADLKYILYVNDTFIGRGPLFGTPDYYSFDSYDLNHSVTNGSNRIWVLVMQEFPGDYMEKEHPIALLAQLILTGMNGKKEYIGTDMSWKCFRDNGWDPHTPRSFYDLTNMEAVEVFDARKSVNKWNHDEKEDIRVHTYSHVRGIRELFPESDINHLGMMWRFLQPRDLPYMTERDTDGYVIRSGEVEPGNVDKHAYQVVPQTFQNLEHIVPAEHVSISNLEAVCRPDDDSALLQAVTAKEYPFRIYYPAFILDFGQIMNGYVQLDLDAPAGCIIDIAYAHVLDDGKIYYKTGHHYRCKRYICREGRQKWESFEFVNARYLQVTVRFPTPPAFCIQQFPAVRIRHIGLRRTDYPMEKEGSFWSENELLNRLFTASDNTAKTCINDRLVDNYYREKNNWSGDVSTVMLPLLYVHGNLDMFRRYFRAFCYEQNPWGSFNIMVPDADDWSWFDHSMSLVIRMEEYITISGDRSFASELYPHVRRYLEFIEKYENRDSIIEYVPYCCWFDWANLNRKDISSTLNLLYLRVLLAAEKIAAWAQAGADVKLIEEKISTLREAVITYFWNEEEGCLAEYRENGMLSGSICEHSNALAISTGCLTSEQTRRVIDRVFGRGMRLQDNASVIKISPTFQYYGMKGLSDAGRKDLVIEFLKCRSGLFIEKLSLDTIPEVWDIDPRTHDSFAQATPPEANIILSELVGFRPKEAGFAVFVFAPAFDLLGSVSACMPADIGSLSTSWSHLEDGVCTVCLDKGDAVCEIVIPDDWSIRSMRIDGAEVSVRQSAVPGKHVEFTAVRN